MVSEQVWSWDLLGHQAATSVPPRHTYISPKNTSKTLIHQNHVSKFSCITTVHYHISFFFLSFALAPSILIIKFVTINKQYFHTTIISLLVNFSFWPSLQICLLDKYHLHHQSTKTTMDIKFAKVVIKIFQFFEVKIFLLAFYKIYSSVYSL